MKKWYIDGIFVRNGRTYDRGYYIVEGADGVHIEWTEPIPGGEMHTFPLSECFHATGEPIMVEDGELLGELVDAREDFPNLDEAYAIPPLGGYQAVADILGVTRAAVYDRWKRMQSPRSRSDFPRPATITSSGPMWNLDEIHEYARRKKLGKYKEEQA